MIRCGYFFFVTLLWFQLKISKICSLIKRSVCPKWIVLVSYLYELKFPTRPSLLWRKRWAQWRLKSPASRLFNQSFIQAQIKESIKASRHWLWAGNSPATSEFPAQRSNKMFPFDDVIMMSRHIVEYHARWCLCDFFGYRMTVMTIYNWCGNSKRHHLLHRLLNLYIYIYINIYKYMMLCEKKQRGKKCEWFLKSNVEEHMPETAGYPSVKNARPQCISCRVAYIQLKVKVNCCT